MKQPSIMIVEDEAIVALDLRMQLEDLGYAVVGVANDLDQAMALAQQSRPSLALMDIQLKGNSDGIEVAALLRRELDLPVIFLTSFSDSSTVRRAAATAPYGYLTKPFQIKEVAAGVEVAWCKAQMERADRAAERSLAYALQCVTDGVILTGDDDQVRFLNPAAEKLTGWDARDAVGQHIDDVVRITVPDEDRHTVGLQTPASPVSTQQKVAVAASLVLHRRDGSQVTVDEWTGPIRDAGSNAPQGQPQAGRVTLLRDATSRVHQEARLQEAQALFRATFDHAPLGMAIVSLDRHVLLANDAFARMVGLDADALIGQHADSLSLATDLPTEIGRLQTLLLDGQTMTQFEKRYRHHRTGALVSALVVVTVFREADASVCYLYQVHDLDAQTAAADAPAEARKRPTRELLSPSGRLPGAAGDALAGYEQLQRWAAGHGSPEVRGYADQVASTGQRMATLVKDVLESDVQGRHGQTPGRH